MRDSKELRTVAREKLAPLIALHLPAVVSHVSVRYIDTYNINRAIQKGLYRVVQRLLKQVQAPASETRVIMDGNYRFSFPALNLHKPMPQIQMEPKADAKYFPVAAAAIVSKVARDRLIAAADARFPGYGLAQHVGYGTLLHRKAIQANGATIFHRKSFAVKPISE